MIYNSNKINMPFFHSLPLRLDADITVAIPFNKINNNYSLYSFYNLGYGYNNTLHKIGHFDGQFNYYENKTLYQSRWNLTGVTIKSASVVLLP